MNENNNNSNNNLSRRHTHAHLHLKPTNVFDHIKTKVKRKRNSSCTSREPPAFVANNTNYLIGDISPREEHQNNVEKTLVVTRSQPMVSSLQSLNEDQDQHRLDINHSSIEKQDDNPPEFIDSITSQEQSLQENTHRRVSSIDTGVENLCKMNKSKLKMKLSKNQSESNVKLQKQSIRPSDSAIRDEDFYQIFPNIPSDESLIIAYPCAWRKEIFMHGRMFLSVNYLCFYTSFFKWEESLCIGYKDILSIKRVKSKQSLPNAIRLRTKNRDEYLFAGYVPRERIFLSIDRLRQNALQERPLDAHQLRKLIQADQNNLDGTTGESDESFTDEIKNRGWTKSTSKIVRTLENLYPLSCPCETHLAKIYAERVFTYKVDDLFELIFGENSFTRAFHDSQKLTDYVIGEWRRNSETGKRERQVTYKTITQSILGTNGISCTEKQIIETEKSHSMYVVNTEVFNEGMKYTDAFYVATRFCMWQRDGKHSFIRISAEVRYVKNVNGIAKAFIEKNCHSNLDDGINNQIRRLEKRQMLSNDFKVKSLSKELDQQQKNDDINSTDSIEVNRPITTGVSHLTKNQFFNDLQSFSSLGIFIAIFLLILHMYLCYKLYSIDRDLQLPESGCRRQCQQACYHR